MEKTLFYIIIFLVSTNCFCQITYDQGYIIDNNSNKIDYLIKNINWKNNPSTIEFKTSETALSQRADLSTIKEFGVGDILKYSRETVRIDRSSDFLGKLGDQRNTKSQTETLLLKVLVEGEAKLYLYESQNLKRFFYRIKNDQIGQLVYKRYLSGNKIKVNNRYKQQLFNALKCADISSKVTEKLKYETNSLVQFFVNYNACKNSTSVNYIEKVKAKRFFLSLRPRVNLSSFMISTIDFEIDYDPKISYGLGLEAEFVMPYYRNKWSIIIEPTFQNYSSISSTPTDFTGGGFLLGDFNYKSIELPSGVRHYFFLNQKSTLFVNVSFVMDFTFDTNFVFRRIDNSIINEIDIFTKQNLAFGTGFEFDNKFNIELRYQTNRNLTGFSAFYVTDYNTLSLIVGYSI